ncbi:imelysin family protein [Noviherbaspirillum aerium]|uniref:imelysin family protein n=1 Tax=Noviherbaspirillum aerium TaxID=2588497 RepID=UPI00124EBCFE|nr:imelysin family protein [Noviherbaspirillum aerium]
MTRLHRRQILKLTLAAVLSTSATATLAQLSGQDVAVPLYKPADVVNGLYRHWGQPRAVAFLNAAKELQQALTSYCGASPANPSAPLATARSAWEAGVSAWERLAAVPFGPLIERRSIRAIDFTPTRPQLIERAIKQAPRGAAAMERIGTPAKGFPALEWLLWEKPVSPGAQACAYAEEVAADIVREADAIHRAFAGATPAEWESDMTSAAFTEFINQWVGSAERLRWQQIERPVRERNSASRSAVRFPRSASGATARSWAAHWESLRALAISTGQDAPRPGDAVIPIDLYLRGRGQGALAERWKTSVMQADSQMRGISPGAQNRLLPAAKSLAATKRMAEDEVAPALNVSIGFSDADGD